MKKSFPDAPYERYADDAVIHVKTKKRADQILEALAQRMMDVKLELHPEKTKIIYCKDSNRKEGFDQVRFDFLGFTFTSRYARNKSKQKFNSFLPGASDKAVKRMGVELRQFRLHLHTSRSAIELARYYNPIISGWINYYGHFYKSRLSHFLQLISNCLIRWAMRKYKRLKRRSQAWNYLAPPSQREPNLWDGGHLA